MVELLKKNQIVIVIFALALVIRFLYFPNNIYFGYDQARDAFVVQELLQGNLRLVGPTTLIDGLFHGPLYYYIFAPIYFLSQGNPELVSAFLRIFNSVGVITVFLIGLIMFGRKTALLAAFLYAVSFEQTQFAIYLNHPSLAVQAVLLYYLGLSLLLFRKKWWGLWIALIGLGLSVQFEFPLIYLFVSFVLMLGGLGLGGKQLPPLTLKQILLSAASFLVIMASFILAEIKFHFKGVETLIYGILLHTGSGTKADVWNNLVIIYSRFIEDSLSFYIPGLIGLGIFFIALFLIWKKYELKKTVFLLIWFGVGLIPYIGNTASIPLYYYSGAASVAAIIFVSFLLIKLSEKYVWLSSLIVLLIVISNLVQIQKFNPYGTIPSINVQSGMLWSDQKKVIDYLYQNSAGKPFAVNALSVPLNVNMVWSYVLEQYGGQKYGYLPVWGGDAAEGYYGHLTIEKARSTLPEKQYLILEPIRGIEQYMIDDFINQENIFTKVVEEKQFGLIKVQIRKKN
jgi:4-amino-4-deoxy-L-arabinose transferase-like glycosyltransferase